MGGDVCQDSLNCILTGVNFVIRPLCTISKRDLMSYSPTWEVLGSGVSYIHSASFASFFFFFLFFLSLFPSPFPSFLPSFPPSLLPPTFLSPSLFPSFSPLTPESLLSPCPCQASGRPLSPKHFQHCHYKLVEMLRHPGRLILSLLQRGRCSAKLASDPQRRLASP